LYVKLQHCEDGSLHLNLNTLHRFAVGVDSKCVCLYFRHFNSNKTGRCCISWCC